MLSKVLADSMIPSVSTPDSWIETVGLVGSSPTTNLADHARPVRQLLGDDLMFPARNAGADRPVVQCGQPHAGHVLQGLDPVDQGTTSSRLLTSRSSFSNRWSFSATSVLVLARSRSTSRSISCCCSSIGSSLFW